MKNKFISRQSNEIVVTKQIQPSTLSIKGVAFQFIYHNTGHFFWAKKIWVNSFNKVTCSDLEKAIIENNEHEDGGDKLIHQLYWPTGRIER